MSYIVYCYGRDLEHSLLEGRQFQNLVTDRLVDLILVLFCLAFVMHFVANHMLSGLMGFLQESYRSFSCKSCAGRRHLEFPHLCLLHQCWSIIETIADHRTLLLQCNAAWSPRTWPLAPVLAHLRLKCFYLR